MNTPCVGIVVPVRNRREKTLRFLESLASQTWPNVLPVIVDSNSTDGTPAAVASAFPRVRIVHGTDDDFWTGATNRGLDVALAAGCEYILTINDDSVVREDLVENLVNLARKFNYPILACRIDYLRHPGIIWSIGARHSWATHELFALNYNGLREEELPEVIRDAVAIPVESAPGNGVLIHASVFEKVGLYDERNTPHYHADTEFLLRCRMHGFTPRVAPNIIVYNDADPEEAHPVIGQNWLITTRLFLTAIRSLVWMLSKRKSHFFFRPHAYVIYRHCPKGLRWRSLTSFLVGVGFVVLDGGPRGWWAYLRERSQLRLRRERVSRLVRIIQKK